MTDDWFSDLRDQQELSAAKVRMVGMDWGRPGKECLNCKGNGRVGIMACNPCGATGRVVCPVTETSSDL